MTIGRKATELRNLAAAQSGAVPRGGTVIDLASVSMRYPLPRPYRHYLLHPFAGPKRKTALKEINLSIAPGSAVGFLGPNGAGKTTLLKLVGGLLYPTEGKVMVCGYDTVRDNHRARSRVGFVLNEDRSFYWRLTGSQNLEFFGALDNLHGRSLHQRVQELLATVGLEGAARTRVSDYSSGMRQRLAIARGMLADPDVLILDEPTRALDPLGAEQIRDIIFETIQTRAGKTVLLATHQCMEAQEICERVCLILGGRLVRSLSTTEILQEYGSVQEYYKAVAGLET